MFSSLFGKAAIVMVLAALLLMGACGTAKWTAVALHGYQVKRWQARQDRKQDDQDGRHHRRRVRLGSEAPGSTGQEVECDRCAGTGYSDMSGIFSPTVCAICGGSGKQFEYD